jgi:hypothetical protein
MLKFYNCKHYHDREWENFMAEAIGWAGEGNFLEFGVAEGNSARFICSHIGRRELHGFDWFKGLPESWYSWDVGHFTTGGECPIKVDNLRIFNGLFDDTLPGYLEDYKQPFAFVHIDCDLYSSTVNIFDWCYDRIVPGTILVFDEALWNQDFMQHEMRAFLEFVETYKKKYEVLSATSDGQMCVRII